MEKEEVETKKETHREQCHHPSCQLCRTGADHPRNVPAGLGEPVNEELKKFLGASPKKLDEIMHLGASVRTIVDAALDEKYKDGILFSLDIQDSV